MGYIAHLRNQFKLINTFVQTHDYIIWFYHISFLIIKWFFFVKPWAPFTQGCFCQVWLKLTQWFLRRFFNAISKLSPFGKGHDPLFGQTWIPFSQGCFVPSFVEIGQVVLEKMKMWNYRQTDGKKNDRQQAIRKAHLSFQLRWAKIPTPIKLFKLNLWVKVSPKKEPVHLWH